MVASEWSKHNLNPSIAWTAGRGCGQASWGQAARAEASTSSGGSSAFVLLDCSDYYESIDWLVLWRRAEHAGFHIGLLRFVLQMAGARRAISWKQVEFCTSYPGGGITAGCAFATWRVQVYCEAPVAAFVSSLRFGRLTVFLDDIGLDVNGPNEDAVVSEVGRVLPSLGDLIEGDLRSKVAKQKTQVVASFSKLTSRVCKLVAKVGLPPPPPSRLNCQPGEPGGALGSAGSIRNLGSDLSAGKPRRLWASCSQLNMRIKKQTKIKGRLRRFANVAGKESGRLLFNTSVFQAASYGNEVYGADDDQLHLIGHVLLGCCTPRTSSKSRPLTLLFNKNPLWRAAVGPLLAWVGEVWRAADLPAGASDGLPWLRQLWDAVAGRSPGSWEDVAGPIGAAGLSAGRLGWTFDSSGLALVNEHGISVAILSRAPRLWQKVLKSRWDDLLAFQADQAIFGKMLRVYTPPWSSSSSL